jgi:spore maturation protein A
MSPVLHFLFPRIPKEHKANEYIAANIAANILGLGWAATPMGLKAMKELAALERERLASQKHPLKKASDEMCTFLVINISSLQLIPVSVIAYRAQYGAVNPASIVLPGLIATAVSTLVAVVFCRLMCRKGESKKLS